MWRISIAWAGSELTPRFDGPPRTYKIDVFQAEPEGPAPAAMEQWTAVVTCASTGPFSESCTFPRGVWWGAAGASPP